MIQTGMSQDFDTRGDQILVRKAMRERWPIKEETRYKIVDSIEKALDNEGLEIKVKLLAARTAISMDALNLKEKELKIRAAPKIHVHSDMSLEQLMERAKELQEELGISHPKEALTALTERNNVKKLTKIS